MPLLFTIFNSSAAFAIFSNFPMSRQEYSSARKAQMLSPEGERASTAWGVGSEVDNSPRSNQKTKITTKDTKVHEGIP